MEYSVEQIRRLTQLWLAGDTSLDEEAALRKFFGGVQEEGLPADLLPYRPLFGQSARAAGGRSHRKLVLHTEPTARSDKRAEGSERTAIRRSLHRWITAAAGIAAAAVAVVAVLVATEQSRTGDIVCVVNGVRISDPAQIEVYTREALEMVSENLKKPGNAVSSELSGTPALSRAAKILENITMEIED
jgi:hypothetical protein